MIVIARSFTGKIWAGSEVFTMADNHVVSVSSDELEEERRHLNAHTARVGVEPFRVIGSQSAREPRAIWRGMTGFARVLSRRESRRRALRSSRAALPT